MKNLIVLFLMIIIGFSVFSENERPVESKIVICDGRCPAIK